MFQHEIIPILIQIGSSADLDDLLTTRLLDSIGGFDAINKAGGWNEVIQPMQTDDLVALTKGLALAEKYHGWIGGSVASAIWTFRELQRRDSTLADEVADWILPRTSNPYVPYGNQNHGARSVEEYRNARRWRNERIHAGLAEQKTSEVRAEADRETSGEQRKRSSRDRNSETRKQLIAELDRLTTVEQLCRIAADTAYDLGFYPTCIAYAATESVRKSLDVETRLALLRKLKGKKRGPWNSFKRDSCRYSHRRTAQAGFVLTDF